MVRELHITDNLPLPTPHLLIRDFLCWFEVCHLSKLYLGVISFYYSELLALSESEDLWHQVSKILLFISLSIISAHSVFFSVAALWHMQE